MGPNNLVVGGGKEARIGLFSDQHNWHYSRWMKRSMGFSILPPTRNWRKSESMKPYQLLSLLGILAAAMLLAACSGAPTATQATQEPTQEAPPTQETAPTEEAATQEATQEAPTTEAADYEVCDPFRIGTFFDITGPGSTLGVPERDTVLMLQEQFNAAGGVMGPDGNMVPVEILVEDSQTNPDQGVLVVRRLIDEEGVPIVVGGTTSPVSIAVKQVFAEAEIPFISVASSSAIVSPVEDAFWVFKTPQQNLPVAQVQAEWIKANGVTRVASIYVNNAFGTDSRDALQAVAGDAGFEIVVEESFEPGDADFTAQLTNVLASDAEALVVHATPGEGAPLTVQARDLGWDKPILHNHGIGTPAFIQLAGDAAEGVMFPIGKLLIVSDVPQGDPQYDVLNQYVEDFTAYAGSGPSTFGGHAWDGIMMAVETYKAVGCNPAAMRDYLETGFTNWPGISGVFNITSEDHTGIGFESLALVMIQDGQFVYVSPEDYTNVP